MSRNAIASPPPADRLERPRPGRELGRWTAGLTLALVVLSLILYANALRGELVYDDLRTLRDNPAIRGLDAFVAYARLQTRPLLALSFALNYSVGGLDPFGYHLVNVLLHGLAAAAVAVLARLVVADGLGEDEARARATAWLAGTLFVAHPAATEAVAYVSSRSSVLATLLLVLATHAHLRGRAGAPWRWGALSVLLFGAGAATKEIALAIPVLLVVLDRLLPWPSQRTPPWRVSLARVVPHAALLAAGVAVRLAWTPAASTPVVPWTYGEHLASECRALLVYLRVSLLPINLTVDHALELSRAFGAPEALGLAALGALVTAALAWRRRRPLAAAGVLWWLVALAPTSLIPLQDLVAERRLYLPAAGAAIAVGHALEGVRRRTRLPGAAGALLVLLVAALGLGTIARNRVWAGPVPLWADAVAKAPDKARPLGNLATALAQSWPPRVEEALALYEGAIARNPDLLENRVNRATLLRLLDRDDDAIGELETVLAQAPGLRLASRARHELAAVYRSRGERTGSAADFARARALLEESAAGPLPHPETFLMLARIAFLEGDLDATEAALVESIHRWPYDAEGHRNLGVVYYVRGRAADAERELVEAARLAPDDPKTGVWLAAVRRGEPIRLE